MYNINNKKHGFVFNSKQSKKCSKYNNNLKIV